MWGIVLCGEKPVRKGGGILDIRVIEVKGCECAWGKKGVWLDVETDLGMIDYMGCGYRCVRAWVGV